MNPFKILVVTGLLSFAFSTLAQNVVTRAEDLSNELGSVDLNSGISKKQAIVIASYYCHMHVPACGSVSQAKNLDARWEVSVETGVAAVVHSGAIYIGKHTGEVLWGDGPSVFLRDILGSPRPAPKPFNENLSSLSDDDLSSAIKIQFSVMPSGWTANHLFLRSSGNMKCDLSARRTVESWNFPPREDQITLVASLKECMADGARW